MGQTVSDYGGAKYGRGRVGKSQLSHRCRDCNTLRYTRKAEWFRASLPRCLACGGPLIETAATEKEQYGGKRERKRKTAAMEAAKAAIRAAREEQKD